jgi:hypothetical protein
MKKSSWFGFLREYHLAISHMARHRKRAAHLCSPTIQWGDIPKQKHDKPMCAGDWMCVDCGSNNFAHRQKCHVCFATPDVKHRCGFDPVKKLEDADVRPGDWQCRTCGHLCYARRRKCFHCLVPREEDVGPLIPFEHELTLPGDWICLKCGYHNFQSRSRCHCCGCPHK